MKARTGGGEGKTPVPTSCPNPPTRVELESVKKMNAKVIARK